MAGERGTVLVTGAAGAIGGACVDRLLAEGFAVHGWDLAPGASPDVAWHAVDVTDWDAVHRAAAAVDTLAAVIHCVADGSREPALSLSRERWARIVDVNINGSFYVARATHDALSRGNGALVNLTSVVGRVGFRNRAPYGATKAAMAHLTRSLAIEWASDGIRVFAVAPGFVDTAGMRLGIEEGATSLDAILGHTPQRRLLEKAEIAEAIVRLIGPEFRGLTGSEILLDAGFDALSGF
jgi:NAD(P)-dependent dehydrogenase (short-subunit alcohol dehydrogenase family)